MMCFVSERYGDSLKAARLDTILPFERASFNARFRLYEGTANARKILPVPLADNVEAFEIDSPVVPMLDALRTGGPVPARAARRTVVTVRRFPSGRFEIAEHPQIGSLLLSLVLRGLSAPDIEQAFISSAPAVDGIPPHVVLQVAATELAARGYLQQI
jgi:hypothetical protein